MTRGMLSAAIATLAAGLVAATPQAPAFEPIQKELLAAGNAFVNAWADFDADGDADLFVGFNGQPNRLYRNDRVRAASLRDLYQSTLTDIASSIGLAGSRPTRAAAWGDYDGDGDPDLLLGFTPGTGSVLELYRNDRSTMTPVTSSAQLAVATGAVRQLSWIDIDADDDLDLFVAFRDRPNALFLNTRGQFSDVAPVVGLADARKSVGAVWFDLEEDGDLDLYLANMDGDANALYRNDKGRFTDVAEAAGLQWGGRAPRDASNGTVRPCLTDADGDGHIDLFMANYGPNGLFLNRGSGRFEDVSAAWKIAIDGRYDTCVFADVNQDGREDFYVNGTVTGGVSYPDYLFLNTGTAFTDATPEVIRGLQADHGAAWADVDRDGMLDLALTGSRPDGMHFVLRNRFAQRFESGSVQVRVVNASGRATRQGAEVRLFKAGTRELIGMRVVDTGSGYNAQNDLPVHFGVGHAFVDVEVTLPRPGRPVSRLTRVQNIMARLVTIATK